jgi:flagellar hook-basal body complex protein FliE
MADAIAPITPSVIRPIEPAGAKAAGAPGAGPSGFADMLKDLVAEVQNTQRVAETASQDFAAGKTTDVAATMIAMERASVTFSLMLQVRNRLLEAYQEIQRIQA